LVVVHHEKIDVLAQRKRVRTNLLALNSSGLTVLGGLLSSLALLEESLRDQDLLSGWCGSVRTQQTTVSLA
jgi:hypothetical protein